MAEFPETPEGFDETAGEYVLGVLDGAAWAAASARAAADPAFAAQVAAWEARLAPLIDEIAPVTPSEAVWRRIAMRLGVVDGGRPARLTDRLGFWRAATAAGFAAAAASLVALVLVQRPAPVAPPTPQPQAVQPLAVARLAEDGGGAVFIATLDPATHRLMVAPATVTASPVHSHELWVVPASGSPRSLGIVYADRALTLAAPADLASGATLAVTAEPLGGSPTGLPTGPVVATGKLAS